jgi:hypothetical protein
VLSDFAGLTVRLSTSCLQVLGPPAREGGLPADDGGVIALTPVYMEGWTARPTMSD